MGKINLKLSERNPDVLIEIDKYLVDNMKKKPKRDYLGGSIIGKECVRQLWYEHHQPIQNEDPRVERIFHVGHLLEAYMISLLKHTGYKVYYQEEDKECQFGFIDGPIAGHIDGVIILNDIPHLLEIKTASSKRFNEMVKKGVQISDPVYYVQMQVYMKYMELSKGLFFAYNKDNSELHFETIDYDEHIANWAVNRGKEVVEMKTPPAIPYKSTAMVICKMCKYREVCIGGSNN